MITDLRTAEMIKYASNAFLATKISFINEIANICEALGADVKEVATGMGYDKRIGRAFLDAGIGYGGSCFPKDVLALAHMAKERGRHPQLIQAVMDINADRRKQTVDKLRELLGGTLQGKKIGILGLAFKPNTDDMRDAPALEVIDLIESRGGRCRPTIRWRWKMYRVLRPISSCAVIPTNWRRVRWSGDRDALERVQIAGYGGNCQSHAAAGDGGWPKSLRRRLMKSLGLSLSRCWAWV